MKVFFSVPALIRATRARRIFRKIPDRGLVDMFSYWVSDLIDWPYKSSLDLMLIMSLVVAKSFSKWTRPPSKIPTKLQGAIETQLDSPNVVDQRIYISL